MNHALQGQRVLVVGGGSRMGLAVAHLALQAGAEVIIASRSATRLAEAGKTLPTAVQSYVADAADARQMAAMLTALAPLDHLVLTASSSGSAGSLVNTEPSDAREPFERFWMAYHAVHYAPTAVRPTGSVTLISGSSGRRPGVGFGFWSTLHGSIEALARAAALELAPIRVNVVSPGGIGMRPDRQLTEHAGQPEDVAAMILAVLSNPAVTNAVVDVDNGERLGTWPQAR
ncbi:SDR family oxidoreductase [Hymenobacter lapidiphilus]|uniref:SDR family oxidoreductase n=1 Tax=Hymenobacter lapidiphilus TaxID=2608003 RepID=A0A7Y7PQM6_9BACT|nr:SDR family oxidoreductase [Hymenobacter lapidiphilus]NVO32259.1 SDR family oxidoreductase [Hymenobacter lapidiphilus]